MVKQVLVWRKDLVVRKGKFSSQIAHASIAWLTRRLQDNGEIDKIYGTREFSCRLSPAEQEWIKGSFTKITLQVENENELLEIYQKAKDVGLVVELITDAGKTEFNGVPTNTCIGIGPDYEQNIDPTTKHLKLY